MPGLVDSASAILASAERKLEASAQNVANASTSGFKRQVNFAEVLGNVGNADSLLPTQKTYVDFTQGRLAETGSLFDLAINGPGLLRLREGEAYVYARGGSFALNEDGLLADPSGRLLQQAGGGDLALAGTSFGVLADGTVLEDGLPTARIGIYEAGDPAALTALGGATFAAAEPAMSEAETSQIRQGFLEKSNVTMSDEMVAMMASLRQAESGGRVMQFYDELIGQAITTFSRSGR
ncbi:flagellar hook basal-body protein [Altererythrobacter sp. CC-YST694]|uniref:flagellar hook-basal body protein n=1 Tax=Altererythrobacter sp. CC-YST694 TaxID=2755038 RepID=UPI001D0297CB|nr:flagellar hook basal-body protein [Altererythrobacter sp. CC-YST694]MCB5423843.1 flagellar hook basal-body protein [Altererythrobacter sp. CC-YST694]